MKPRTNNIETKIRLFSDASALQNYTSTFTKGLPTQVSSKFMTYVGLRSPEFWDKASLDVLLALCRMEAQIDLLTREYDNTVALESLDEVAIKKSKLLSQATASLVTQTTSIAQRLCLTQSMLHGSSTRLVTQNAAAREANALLAPINDQASETDGNISYEEAKRRSIEYLENKYQQ